MLVDEAHTYIKSLRKPSKRAYAQLYWAWLVSKICQSGFSDPEPEPSNLSVMGAQAVRLRLNEFTEGRWHKQ